LTKLKNQYIVPPFTSNGNRQGSQPQRRWSPVSASQQRLPIVVDVVYINAGRVELVGVAPELAGTEAVLEQGRLPSDELQEGETVLVAAARIAAKAFGVAVVTHGVAAVVVDNVGKPPVVRFMVAVGSTGEMPLNAHPYPLDKLEADPDDGSWNAGVLRAEEVILGDADPIPVSIWG
jgi:hypothetical protein